MDYGEQRVHNLNNLTIPTDNTPQALIDNSDVFQNVHVDVHFRNLRERLIAEIQNAECVVGCVAWLTDFEILRALARVRSASIVVQKEDFLRPDTDANDGWKSEMKSLYRHVPGFAKHEHAPLAFMSYHSHPYIEAIRCVGNYNREKKPAAPRMHNKFLVFCSRASFCEGGEKRVGHVPIAVWTGSFNFTKNAGRSFENAVVIRDRKVARAYYQEWGQIAALSEPLDWDSDWCSPEWRVGT